MSRTSTSGAQVEVFSFSAPVTFGIPLIAIFLQAWLPLRLSWFSVLDLPLLVTIFFAMARRNPITGLLTGTFIGLFQDALTHQALGVYGIAKTVVGYGASSLGIRIDSENPGARILLTLVFYVVHKSVYFLIAAGLVGQSLRLDWLHEILSAVANAIFGVVLYSLLDRFKRRI